MTTIIIHQPTMRVYADTCTTVSGYSAQKSKTNCKLHRIEGGGVITGCGNRADILKFYQRYTQNKKMPTPEELGSDVYIVTRKGDALQVLKYTTVKTRFGFKLEWELTEEYIQSLGYTTAGSGKYFAAGALGAGASPEEAIKIAGGLDTSTSCDCDVFDLRSGEFACSI